LAANECDAKEAERRRNENAKAFAVEMFLFRKQIAFEEAKDGIGRFP
jgi:hypothetical protein